MTADLLDRLRAADPAAGATPSTDRARSLDALVEALVSHEPPGPARSARAERRRLTAGVLVGAAACAMAAVPILGGDRPGAVSPASAAAVLERAAAPDASGSGPWAYTKTLDYVSHVRGTRRGGGTTFVTIVPTTYELWLAADGRGVMRTTTDEAAATYPTEADRRAAKRAGPVPPPAPMPTTVRQATVGGIPARGLADLPTQPAALRERLRGAGAASDQALVQRAAMLLASPLTPADVRTALAEVLRTAPGARRVGTLTDPRGRSGEAVEFSDEAWDTLLLFDRDSGRLLGIRSRGKRELPGRTIEDWSLILDRGLRKRAPEAVPPAAPSGPPPTAPGAGG